MTSPTTTHPEIARTVPVLAVCLLLLAVVAGALPRTGAPASTPSTGPVAVPAPEQAYLDTARAHGVTGSEAAMLNTARNVCADLNSGGDVGRVTYYVAQRGGLADGDARAILRAAVDAYCPVNGSRVGG